MKVLLLLFAFDEEGAEEKCEEEGGFVAGKRVVPDATPPPVKGPLASPTTATLVFATVTT